MEEEMKEGQEEGKMEREEGSMEPEQSVPLGDHERQLSPGPSGPAAAAMASCHECGEEEPANTVEGEATAAVAMVITVEVGVDEVEPHSVQLDYSQVCVCMTWHGMAACVAIIAFAPFGYHPFKLIAMMVMNCCCDTLYIHIGNDGW